MAKLTVSIAGVDYDRTRAIFDGTIGIEGCETMCCAMEFFGTYDLLLTPGALTPAFDVNLRNAATIGGQKLDNYLGSSIVTAVITLSACPAMAVPCGFDQFGRPVGLQLVEKPRGEAALLQAAVLFEELLGLDRLLPIDPKPGAVPPNA